METSLVSRHEKCISVVHKDHKTIFKLVKPSSHASAATQSSTASNALKLVEFDITTQTVCSITACLVFEHVQAHDTDYSLVYDSGFLLLIYPTQMICVYQDNSYFGKRLEDPQCRGLDFFDHNLLGADDGAAMRTLALKHVVQSNIKIRAPLLQNNNLIFSSSRVMEQDDQESTFLISLPLSELDTLRASAGTGIFDLKMDAKAKLEREIFVCKSPLLDLTSEVTDLIQVSKTAYAVTYTCGTIWIQNVAEQDYCLLGLAYLTEFLGQEIKSSCVNTIDHMLIPWKRSLSMHPSLFDESLEDGPRATEYLAIGDESGNLVLYKNRKPAFYDQFTYGQVAAFKFLSVNLDFAIMSSDGVLRVCRFRALTRRQGDSKNVYEVEKLVSVQSFEELNSQLRLRRIHLRGSVCIQTHSPGSVLESAFGTIQVLWPNRILMKVNNKRKQPQSGEDRFFAECELQIHKVFHSFHPIVKRDYTPIVLSNVLPMQFKDFVPQPDDETGQVEMHCERYCFFVDKIQAAGAASSSAQSQKNAASFKYWICSYDYTTDTRTPLVNVSAESGVQEVDHFNLVRLDMRPAGVDPASGNEVAKFLCTLELSSAQAGMSGMCCSFTVDMQTGNLTQNNLLLSGKTGIYLGKLDYKDPSILVLQEEMRSLIIFSFDEGDLESKLPHGEVVLSNTVNGVFWTPMRDGLAVLYELQHENLLTFSKNRLDRYSVKDFGILVSRNIGLKLHYEERIFDVKWTGFSIGCFAAVDDRSSVKGVVGTNQHIYFVDDKLGVLGVIKWHQQAITSLHWMGNQTVLVSTRNHLLQVYCERNPKAGVVLSLTDCLQKATPASDSAQNVECLSYEAMDSPETPIIVKALADRVILASQKLGGPVQFLTRPILMLEPILLGYLAATTVGKADVQSVQRCLKYLDTVAISQKLLQALNQHGMAKSVKFLLKNQPMLTSKVGLQPHQLLRIEDFIDFLQAVFPQKDLLNCDADKVNVRKKLALDPACTFQQKLLQKRIQICLKKSQYLDAFTCADLLQDIDSQVKILQQATHNDRAIVRQFLTVASATESYQTVQFEYRKRSDDSENVGFQLKNRHNVDQVLKHVPEKQINKLMLAFDEVPLSYGCPDGADGNDQPKFKPMAPVAFNSENFSTFIGVRKYVDPGLRNAGGGGGNAADQSEEDSADGMESFDSQADEIDERKHLKAYWRAEEGHGDKIADVSDKDLHLQAATAGELVWQSHVNAEHDPLDYEDKWGKVNNANYSIYVPNQGLKIAKKAGQALSKRTGEITLEMWLKEPEPNAMLVLSLITAENQASVFLCREDGKLLLQLYNLTSKDQAQTIELPHVDLTRWTHIALRQKSDPSEQLTFAMNFEQMAEFKSALMPLKDSKSEFSILSSISADQRVLVTEMRLWQVVLSARQLKNMARQPLSLLFEQKRNLNIQINKNKAKNRPSRASILAAQPGPEEVKDGESQPDATAAQAVQESKPAKKKGGLKFTSKLDAKKTSAPPKQAIEVAQESTATAARIDDQVETLAAMIKQPEKQMQEIFAFGGFDMVPTAAEKDVADTAIKAQQSTDAVPKPSAPDSMFSFGDDFAAFELKQEPTASQQPMQPPVSAAPDSQFFSFDAFAPPPQQQSDMAAHAQPSVDFFDNFSIGNVAQADKVEAQPEAPPAAASFDMFNFGTNNEALAVAEEKKVSSCEVGADAELNDDELCDDDDDDDVKSVTAPIPSSMHLKASVDQLDTSRCSSRRQSDIEQVSGLQEPGPAEKDIEDFHIPAISAQEISERPKTGLIKAPEEAKVSNEPEELKGQEEVKSEFEPVEQQAIAQPDPEDSWTFDEMISKVELLIGTAQLQDAERLIQKALDKCKIEAKTVQNAEEKSVVKIRIRKSIVMKFTCDLAVRISEIKARIEAAESSFQKANLKSQIASMANVLILLKLPDAMRLNFFRFALKQNQAIENYSALTKIIVFWKKYSVESPGAALSDKDKLKIQETEALCVSRQNRNVQLYHGDDCPQCGANLAFGLATPQCHKCKAKIAVCYQLLKPILKDKQTLKCHVCLAQFSIYASVQPSNVCPYCQLVKLKLNTA